MWEYSLNLKYGLTLNKAVLNWNDIRIENIRMVLLRVSIKSLDAADD